MGYSWTSSRIEVERIGLTCKQDIEEYGIEAFNKNRESVFKNLDALT